MSLVERIMENTFAYKIWQAPFAERKLEPIRKHNDLANVRKVLDVGCGPGTNTRHFLDKEYLGVDINDRYVHHARQRYQQQFVTADVTQWQSPTGGFDFILVNSFLHHVDDESCDRILAHLTSLLATGGHLHILELVLPDRPTLSRGLARLDRGQHPRSLDEWANIFDRYFSRVIFEPYSLGVAGFELWRMVYFKGGEKKA